MSSPESPVLSPLLAAGAMAHGDDDGGGWLSNSEQDRPDWDPDWDRERWKEKWKQQWREQRQQHQRQQEQGKGQEQRWPAVAGSALPRSSASGGFVLQPLVFDRSGHRPESELEPELDAELSPSGGPSASVRQAARLHADQHASIGDANGEVVREWSQLYRMTSVAAGTGVEARGKKAQYEQYFQKTTDANTPDDPETRPCGCVCQSAVARVTDNPWKWFTGVPLSLMWNILRLVLVASAVHSIVRCHLQWYVGEAMDCISVLETLVRLALVLNVAAAMQETAEAEEAKLIAARAEADEAGKKVQREAEEARAAAQDTAYREQAEQEAAVAAGGDDWNQGRARLQRKKETWPLKKFMEACVVGMKLVARPACAPAMVLALLGTFAWMPATYFVGSKTRNWDWADDFVAASLLDPGQVAANIDAMKKSETQGKRAAHQTEQLFFYGLGLSIEIYCLLRLLRCWLEAQLRRLNALTHWDELSRAFLDDLYQQAFQTYDKDRDKSITKQELEVSPPDDE
eukprot:COSAG02_NODE_1014_length_15195_cov_11.098105_12_plen_516_part_00